MRKLLLAAILSGMAFGCSQDSPTAPLPRATPRIEQAPFSPTPAGDERAILEESHARLLQILDLMGKQQLRRENEDFNCVNVEEVRVRFSQPGFIHGLDVGLFVKFIGMPAGNKKLRVWWDYENDFNHYQDIAVGDGDINPEDRSKFDVELVIEHTFRESGAKRVRVELIVEGSTGNCARNRDIVVTENNVVTPGVSFDHVATFAGVGACSTFPFRSMGIGVTFTPPLPPGTNYTVVARVDGTGVVAPSFITTGFSNAAGTDFVFPAPAFALPPADFSATFNTTAEHKKLLIAANIFVSPPIPSMSVEVLSIDIPGKTVGVVGTLAGSCP